MNPMPPEMEEAPAEGFAEAPQEIIAHAKQQEIKNLLRFTSRRHPIHQLMEAKTGRFLSHAAAPTQLCKILRDAPDYQWRERTAAALALREIPLAPAQARYAARVLGDVMNNMDTASDMKTERETRETLHTLGLIGAVILGVIGIGAGLSTGIISEGLHKMLFDFGCFAVVTSVLWVPALISLTAHRRNQLRLACAVTLRKLKLPTSIRALAVAARSRKEYDGIAVNALLEVLPLLTPKHYGRLEGATVPELNNLLRTAPLPPGTLVYSEPLCGAVLDALAVIGDGRAVKPVQNLSEKCRAPQVRAKALEILPLLLSRQAKEQAHSVLLRSSAAPAASEKELLRAASAAPETAPETLLRASQE